MKTIIVGLGNPGQAYSRTYHNVGRLFMDYLADETKKFKNHKLFLYANSGKNILVKTNAYMNESGLAVEVALKHFGTTLKGLIVVHDDSDLQLGAYKLSVGRGSAGHKGVDSIIERLGHSDFKRLRIGIRPLEKALTFPNQKARLKAREFVLKNITDADWRTLYSLFAELKLRVIEKST